MPISTRTRGLLAAAMTICAAGAVVLAQNGGSAEWWRWRGPNNNGVATGDAPLTWSDTSHVRWKVDIPGRGFSTPLIVGDRIFLTTAVPTGTGPAASEQAQAAGDGQPPQRGPGGGAGHGLEHRLEVMALDRGTGKVVWTRTATTAVPHEGYHRLYGSFASNSPATDGKRLFASFGSRGVYAYDLDGKLLWQKDLGVKMQMRLQFGEGAATVLHDNRLILNFDHQAGSFIVMLNADDGREIWRQERDEISTWTTPFVATHAGKRQIIVSASNKVRAYDFETGKPIWEAAGLGVNVIPQPVQQGDLVFVMSGYRDPKMMAIRLGRSGDLTGTDAIVWSTTRGLAYTASPVLHDNRLYVISDSGLLSVFNATTGEPAYAQQRLPKPYNFKASPVAAGGKLYLATEEGDVVVVRLGDTFEVVATNTLADQSFIASPVIVGGDIYLRSRTHLFRIGGDGGSR